MLGKFRKVVSNSKRMLSVNVNYLYVEFPLSCHTIFKGLFWWPLRDFCNAFHDWFPSLFFPKVINTLFYLFIKFIFIKGFLYKTEGQ